MPSLLNFRDLQSEADGVRNTFSSWDNCMAQDYCKYPVIVAIVIGSLILLSVLWCCTRCLCCGMECCCGCLSCFNRCCPSPRSRKSDGYEQPQSSYPQRKSDSQYQSPPPPMYFGGGHRPAQTAIFDAPSNRANDDSLPAMPVWQDATSHRVEEEDVEMEKLDHPSQGLLEENTAYPNNLDQNTAYHNNVNQDTAYHNNPPLRQNDRYYNSPPQDYNSPPQAYNSQPQAYNSPSQAYNTGDLGRAPPSPYHDYAQHQQFVPSPVSTQAPSEYPPTYHTGPPSSAYTNQYAPPTYRTAPPSVASPTMQHAQPGGYGYDRRPAQGSWRDV